MKSHIFAGLAALLGAGKLCGEQRLIQVSMPDLRPCGLAFNYPPTHIDD